MKITWDEKAEAVYVYLDVEHGKHGTTQELNTEVYLDYDVKGVLYGIEVLCTKKPNIVEIGRRYHENKKRSTGIHPH